MGSTEKLEVGSVATEDHPHIHGEHITVDVVVVFAPGSPPYTWGAPIHQPR